MASDPEHNAPPNNSGGGHHHQSSPTDLFSSASLLAGAAKSSFTHDGAALDKAKLAEASENLIDAASEYGKLQERGYGSYVEKAETYLHQLHSSPATEKKATEGEQQHSDDHEEPKEEKKVPEEHESGGGGGFGGFGDYMKVAEGFFKK